MREFIRHPASVPFQLEQLDGEFKHGLSTLNNVSFGGVSCLSSDPVEKGKSVKLRVECINPDFEVTGKAVWCRIKDDLYEIGIEFILSKDKAFLLRMIEQICHIEHYRNEVLQNEHRKLTSEEAAREWIDKYAGEFPTS